MTLASALADIVFFVYPSVSAKIFTTFNCEKFDGEFDGSDSWMRVDLTIDCNAPERGGWIAYAVIMSARRIRTQGTLDCAAL